VEFGNTVTITGDGTADQLNNTSFYNTTFSGALTVTAANALAFYEAAFFSTVTFNNVNYLYVNGAQFNDDWTIRSDNTGDYPIPANGVTPGIAIALGFIANDINFVKGGTATYVFQPQGARMGRTTEAYTLPVGWTLSAYSSVFRGTWTNNGTWAMRNSNNDNPIAGTAPTYNGTIGGNIVIASGNITGGNLTTAGLTNSGTLSVTGNANVGNLGTAGLIVATGNITGGNIISVGNASVTGNITVGGILTDDYYYANGAPVDFQQAAGSNTQIQFNLDDDFGASANFTFDSDTNLLTVTGNIGVGNIDVSGAGDIATLTVDTFANITATTAASSNITGALRVAGGVGIIGNVYAGDMYSNDELVLTVESTIDGGVY
jgi:hypothetical protein